MALVKQDAFSIGADEIIGHEAEETLTFEEYVSCCMGDPFQEIVGINLNPITAVKNVVKEVKKPFESVAKKVIPNELKPFLRIVTTPISVATAPLKFVGNIATTGKIENPAKAIKTMATQFSKDAVAAGKLSWQNPWVRRTALGFVATLMTPVAGPAGYAALAAVEAAISEARKNPATKVVANLAVENIKISARAGDKVAKEALDRWGGILERKKTPIQKLSAASSAIAKAKAQVQAQIKQKASDAARAKMLADLKAKQVAAKKPVAKKPPAKALPVLRSVSRPLSAPLAAFPKAAAIKTLKPTTLKPVASMSGIQKLAAVRFLTKPPPGVVTAHLVTSQGLVVKPRRWQSTAKKTDTAGWLVVGNTVSKGFFKKA